MLNEEMDKMYKEHMKKKIEYGLSQGEFIDELWVFCPYCGYRQKDWYECTPEYEDDWNYYDCEKCERKFQFKRSSVFSTRTKEKEWPPKN